MPQQIIITTAGAAGEGGRAGGNKINANFTELYANDVTLEERIAALEAVAGLSNAPYNVTGLPGDTFVSLTWNAPTAPGGTITDYIITVYEADGVTVAILPLGASSTRNVGSTTTAFSFTGLASGVTYTFSVVAAVGVVTSPQSPLSPAITTVPGASLPLAPVITGVVAGSPASTAVSIAFTQTANAATITGYRIVPSRLIEGTFTLQSPIDVVGTTSPIVASGLVPGSTYTFIICALAGAICGPPSNVSPQITTASGDVTAPTLATVNPLYPADDALGVAANTNLIINFSEEVQIGTGNITVTATGGAIFATIPVGSIQVSISGGTQVTIDISPSTILAADTIYHVNVDATAFRDVAGNFFAGIAGTSAWNFRTAVGSTATVYWGKSVLTGTDMDTSAELIAALTAITGQTAVARTLAYPSSTPTPKYLYYAYPFSFSPQVTSIIINGLGQDFNNFETYHVDFSGTDYIVFRSEFTANGAVSAVFS